MNEFLMMKFIYFFSSQLDYAETVNGLDQNRFARKTVSQQNFTKKSQLFSKWISMNSCFEHIFSVFCLTPPVIEHARHSALPEQATFELDSTVQYHCYTGYVTAGFPRAKCLAIDGQASW